MFSFLSRVFAPSVPRSRFITLHTGNGHPVLVNCDRVSSVFVRIDRHGRPCGCAIDIYGNMTGVVEDFGDVVAALKGEAVAHV